jgi:hypothetical protein
MAAKYKTAPLLSHRAELWPEEKIGGAPKSNPKFANLKGKVLLLIFSEEVTLEGKNMPIR